MIYYEKIKASTRTPEDLLFGIQNFGAPKREFDPGPRNTIGGLLTYLNENRIIFNISHFHFLLFLGGKTVLWPPVFYLRGRLPLPLLPP